MTYQLSYHQKNTKNMSVKSPNMSDKFGLNAPHSLSK